MSNQKYGRENEIFLPGKIGANIWAVNNQYQKVAKIIFFVRNKSFTEEENIELEQSNVRKE